jgi:predicted nucleic acid-binding protein
VKENPRAKARLAALEATDRVVICTVVRGEVLYGLELMPDGRRKLNLARKINEKGLVLGGYSSKFLEHGWPGGSA